MYFYASERRCTMDLKTYLYNKRQTIADFSREIKYSKNFITNVVNGRIKAGIKLARIIEEYTQGEIKAHEIISEKSPKGLCPHCKGIL